MDWVGSQTRLSIKGWPLKDTVKNVFVLHIYTIWQYNHITLIGLWSLGVEQQPGDDITLKVTAEQPLKGHRKNTLHWKSASYDHMAISILNCRNHQGGWAAV